MKRNIWKILTIALPLVIAGLLLFPTYRAYDLEHQQNEIKASNDSARLEQFNSEYGEALRDAMSKRIKLGLDLRGGMYVMLEVDVLKLIEESALRESRDETFEQVIEKTQKETTNSDEPVLDVFLRNFKAIAGQKGRSLITYFDMGESQDLSDAKIIEQLQNDINSAIDQAKEVIRQRIDKFGISEPSITKQGTRRIVVELPGVKDSEEMRQLLGGQARLEFKLLRNNQEIPRSFYAIDKYLTRTERPAEADENVAKPDTVITADTSTAVAEADSAKQDSTAQIAAKKDSVKKDSVKDPYAGLSQEEAQKRYRKDHPFSSLVATFFVENEKARPQPADGLYLTGNFPDGEYLFHVSKSTYEKLSAYINRADIRKMLPADYQLVRAAKEISEPGALDPVYELYSLKRDPELTGDAVTNAVNTFDPMTNEPVVMMEMSSEGAERWAQITGANIKKRIAIVLDDQVYSAPVVQNKIPNGTSTITGMKNAEEAKLLQIVLKAGALKAPVKIIEEQVVGPSLGADSIRSGLMASAIAFSLVLLFMVIYYAKGGLVANMAVIINVLLILTILTPSIIPGGGTLTLPGIAGIILTIGMAVDANILIYERIREELARGRSLRGAVDEGFKKAFSAILDSNVTTFLTGLILYFLGTGPIQGFALTLIIGILTTLFTAITVSRAMLELMIDEKAVTFNFGQPKNA
ncbi:protein translocase subunit SecD [Ignavibacteria bacterium]|nr:protein translocase subunit SecD [Bacteroidota bacterium]MCZ2131660.1 protein translocase subunit SecD [Bacteroidota bacterium]